VIDVNGEDQASGSDLWTMDGEERTQSLGRMDQEARGWTMMDSTLNNNEQEHMEMVMKKMLTDVKSKARPSQDEALQAPGGPSGRGRRGMC
jgi:hypothetical protein